MNIKGIKEQQALKYIKERINVGIHPSYKELNKQFHISRYGVKLSDLYPKLGISLLEIKCKRPNASSKELKQPLINFVKEQVQKEIYPTRRFIENNFRIRLTGLFSDIKELYKQAGVEYVLKCNQDLKNRKAVLLQNIVLDLLPFMNLTLVKERGTHDRGVDLITMDKVGNTIGVEIKAHHKYEPIKKRNILQLKRFLEKENLRNIILITTSSRINVEIDDARIKVINFENIAKLCNKEQLDILKQIREEVVHQDTNDKEKMKEKILLYAKERIEQKGRVTHLDLMNHFHIEVRSYFKSIYEIYGHLGVIPPLDQMDSGRRSFHKNQNFRNEILLKIVNYLKIEVAKGHYPNGVEVGKQFGVSNIWNFFTMAELYEKAGLEPYLKRKKRIKKLDGM